MKDRSSETLRIAVLLSGEGTSFENLCELIESGEQFFVGYHHCDTRNNIEANHCAGQQSRSIP